MSRLVVDASVTAKWFLAESGSISAIALLNGADDLIGPELLVVETAAAIVRQFRLGSLQRSLAERLLADAHAVFKHRSISLEPDAGLLPRAEEIAIALCHPLQDCLYVACAEAAGAELVTTDGALVKRASSTFSFVKQF